MSIESALKTHLQTQLSVSVHPHVAPQGAAYPYIVYAIQDLDIEHYLNNNSSNTLTEITFDLGLYTETVASRASVLTNIKSNTVLHGFSGDMGTENLNIRSSRIDSVSTFSEADLTGSDEQIYRASLTVTLFFNWS